MIVNVTQCEIGAVASDIYETGRALAAVGIVGGGDMTTEVSTAGVSQAEKVGVESRRVYLACSARWPSCRTFSPSRTFRLRRSANCSRNRYGAN